MPPCEDSDQPAHSRNMIRHYEDTPIQNILKISPPKTENFKKKKKKKNSDIFTFLRKT